MPACPTLLFLFNLAFIYSLFRPASGLARRETFAARGEEGTADEDVTWNVELYDAGERRSLTLDARGEEATADEDVTWNVSLYDEGSGRWKL